MADFSIRKVSVNPDLTTNNEAKTPFAKAKAEYNAKKDKIKNSDFANSPVALNDTLEELKKLKELAVQEDLKDEIKWVETEIESVEAKLEAQTKSTENTPYYKPILDKQYVEQDETKLFDEIIEKYSEGETRELAKELVSSLKESKVTPYHTAEIIKSCEDENGNIEQNLKDAVLTLLSNEFGSNAIQQILHEFMISDVDAKRHTINQETLNSLVLMKNKNINEFDAIQYQKFIQDGNFEDKKAVENHVITLHKAGIECNSLIEILNSLSVFSPDTNKKKIDPSSVRTIATLKKTLNTTRKNEVAERHSELGQLAQRIIEMGSNLIFLKNGHIDFISPKEDNKPQVLRERYFKLANETEDSILIDIAKKHKQAGGKLDANYTRVLSVLRNAGIVYNDLDSLVKFSVSDSGEIDFNTVDSISKLKKAGALSQDIKLLLENCEKIDGKHEEATIQDMCDLSSFVIPGENVIQLLSFVKDNEEAKSFIEYISQFFEDKNNVVALSSTAKRSDGVADQNKMDTVSVLLRDKYDKNDKKTNESKFIEDVNSLVEASQNNETKEMNDDAAGVISIMSNNGASFEDIHKGIEMCKNKDGIVDEKLSQILWDMTLQKATLDEISSLIAVCTDEEKNVDTQKADMIISLLGNKFSKDDIIKLLIK